MCKAAPRVLRKWQLLDLQKGVSGCGHMPLLLSSTLSLAGLYRFHNCKEEALIQNISLVTGVVTGGGRCSPVPVPSASRAVC